MNIKIPPCVIWIVVILLALNLFPVLTILVGLILLGYWIGKHVNVSEALEKTKKAIKSASDSFKEESKEKDEPKRTSSKKKKK